MLIDWRLVALVCVFAWVLFFVRKHEEWTQPILVAVAAVTLAAALLFLGIPLIH
ncbi:hypothetical protein ACTG9Q_28615 [Actinokineospora sp. 24-640]